MADTIYLVQNDTEPLEVVLRSKKGIANLEGATVKFAMVQLEGTKRVQRDCVVIAPGKKGKVQIPWQDGDLDTIGLFEGEWQTTWVSPDRRLTFPTKGTQLLDVRAEIVTP